jgi:hypothetical protein
MYEILLLPEREEVITVPYKSRSKLRIVFYT